MNQHNKYKCEQLIKYLHVRVNTVQPTWTRNEASDRLKCGRGATQQLSCHRVNDSGRKNWSVELPGFNHPVGPRGNLLLIDSRTFVLRKKVTLSSGVRFCDSASGKKPESDWFSIRARVSRGWNNSSLVAEAFGPWTSQVSSGWIISLIMLRKLLHQIHTWSSTGRFGGIKHEDLTSLPGVKTALNPASPGDTQTRGFWVWRVPALVSWTKD